VWVARFAHGRGTPVGAGVTPDGSSVFVTGHLGEGQSSDFETVAYDAETGGELWKARYDGPAGVGDTPRDIAVSPDGSVVFVVGVSGGAVSEQDFATIAYDAATGSTRWVRRYGGPLNDNAVTVGVAPGGARVYVSGPREGGSTSFDFATVAYDAASGTRLWEAIYDASVGGSEEIPAALGVDPGGSSVYVTGTSEGVRRIPRYLTVSYDAETGAERWVDEYSGPQHFGDYAAVLHTSPDGARIYVSGSGYGTTGADFATVSYDAATGHRVWSARTNHPASEFLRSIAVSPDGGLVFATGSTQPVGASYPSYLTVAYDATTGHRAWVARHNGQLATVPLASGVSPDGGSLYVTGLSHGPTGSYDFTTIAYDASSGVQAWLSQYNGARDGFDEATALAVSPTRPLVYVSGTSRGVGFDFATVAYSTP
jgi:DNA-binding beta-propeller fold protein YncE